MTDSEFFKLDQETWFQEFVETQLSKNLPCTNQHIEIFEFDDVPQ
jgi:hypothetical protein